MGDHLPPANAAQVWTQGESLYLRLDGHTVAIPLSKMVPDHGLTGLPVASQRGFAVLREILRAREIASAVENKIGYNGSPPKHLVETAVASDEKYTEWLKAMNGQKIINAEAKAEAEALLKKVGLL